MDKGSRIERAPCVTGCEAGRRERQVVAETRLASRLRERFLSQFSYGLSTCLPLLSSLSLPRPFIFFLCHLALIASFSLPPP